MKWCLESVADAGRGWLANIETVPFVIGRADDCDLKLIDNRISRHHSELRISSGLLWIRDLESTNGTYVNKNRIEHAQLLEPDDMVSIGSYRFKVKHIDASSLSVTTRETTFGTLSEEFQGHATYEPKLRALLRARNVIPHFQRILRLSDKTDVGYEVLGRIEDDDLPSNPFQLLDIAETVGCAGQLSALFREVGVEIGKELPGSPLLFVNTTRFEVFEMDTLIASLERIRTTAPKHQIVLEINEKAAADAHEFPRLHDVLKEMEMGLAFDDFGVGQTRLVELSTISPDYLKFDMSLIRQIHLAPKRLHRMIATFIKASHDLGILTLAEGIECDEEAQICAQLGFDLGQGYHFGRPVPAEALGSQ